MDLEACAVGSLQGVKHRVGNSSRDSRIGEARKDSGMEDLEQMGCRDAEDNQTPQALTDGLRLREVVGKGQDNLQA
jgi:hypothetical protein